MLEASRMDFDFVLFCY